jgi:hypothetical protein
MKFIVQAAKLRLIYSFIKAKMERTKARGQIVDYRLLSNENIF